jgi:hypothetical protein
MSGKILYFVAKKFDVISFFQEWVLEILVSFVVIVNFKIVSLQLQNTNGKKVTL